MKYVYLNRPLKGHGCTVGRTKRGMAHGQGCLVSGPSMCFPVTPNSQKPLTYRIRKISSLPLTAVPIPSFRINLILPNIPFLSLSVSTLCACSGIHSGTAWLGTTLLACIAKQCRFSLAFPTTESPCLGLQCQCHIDSHTLHPSIIRSRQKPGILQNPP
jgi:hypothetical protein